MLFLFVLSAYGKEDPLAVPDEIKQKYEYLYREKVQRLPDGSISFHKGRLFMREGIRVLYLKGDPFEMAFQHGKLLKDEILRGALPQTAKLIDHTIANTLGDRPLLFRVADLFIQLAVTDPLIKNTVGTNDPNTAPMMAQAYGLSESTGIDTKTIVEALLAPDLLILLAAATTPGAEPQLASPLIGNCSDFAAWGRYTPDGKMVIGRNLDYPLNGYYDRYPTIIYFDPVQPGSQRYMAAASAGVHNAGMSAINESGIFVGVHTVPTSDVSQKGKPVFLIGNEVIRTARNFQEALDIFKRYPPSTGYTYTLVSTRERRAAAIELTNQHMAIRETKGEYHVQANHFLAPEMKPLMLYVNYSVDEDSFARHERMKQVIEQKKGQIEKKVAMAILGDKWDPYSKRFRGHGNTVAVHTTMTSVVILPDESQIYVSNGQGPASQGKYVSFPLVSAFNPERFMSESYEVIDNGTFAASYPKLAKAEQLYIEAKKAYEYQNDARTALSFMREAVATDGDNPNYFFILGILALKEKLFDEAWYAFDRILTLEQGQHITRLAHYYRGRMLAQEGNRSDATKDFTMITDDPQSDPKLRAAAEKALTKTRLLPVYRIKPLELNLLMQWADMQGY